MIVHLQLSIEQCMDLYERILPLEILTKRPTWSAISDSENIMAHYSVATDEDAVLLRLLAGECE